MSSSWRSSAGSSTDDFRFETKLNGGMLLKVYKASITSLNVDAIVNAANDTMMHGGGVARVISQAAGYDLDRESRQYIERHGQLGVAKNIVTTAGRLPYKAVIHAVGPMWHDYNR
jgi:poly [ADP-ribose] polymerase 9